MKRRGLRRRSRRQGLVPDRRRQRQRGPATLPARRPRLHALLPRAARSLAEHRRVIFYDQLGCGRSDRPDDLSLWTVDRFVAELAQVREALDLDRLHLFGSSWGGMLAMQYVLDRGSPVGPGEPDPVRQPGQHDPLGRRLQGTAGRGDPPDPARHPRARGERLHRLPRVPGRHPGFLPQARVPPRPVAGCRVLVRRGGSMSTPR